MAFVGVSIVKRVAFRDATQDVSNTYHYQWTGLDPSAALATSLIDRLVELEKQWHSADVSFVYARCWNAGGTQAENDMITEKPLSGVGGMGAGAGQDRERAYLVYWRAGVDTKGRPVYLRKWYHSLASVAGVVVSDAIRAQTTGFTRANRDTIKAAFAALNPITFNAGSTVGDLRAASGRSVSGDMDVHKYLEHRQLGDQWRG